MNHAIEAYRNITVTEEFRTLERMRADARHNEAAALYNARREGQMEGRREESEKWRKVVEDKDVILADKDAILADKDAEIARLRELLGDWDG
jgi:hypothetical protein